MNPIAFGSLTLQERGHARGGTFRYYDLLHGSEGSPDNFYLSIGVLGGDFVSPRHRHNFDQVRSSSRAHATLLPTARCAQVRLHTFQGARVTDRRNPSTLER